MKEQLDLFKHQSRDTSLLTWQEIQDTLPESRKRVYNAIKKLGVATDQQISGYLNRPINQITPRRGELEKGGLIVDHGITLNEYGRKVHQWTICLNR